MQIEWKEPPAQKRGRDCRKRQMFVAELRKRPGEWALYTSSASHTLAYINQKDFPGTEWTCRKNADGRFEVFARAIAQAVQP
jgi:hypothetical protein